MRRRITLFVVSVVAALASPVLSAGADAAVEPAAALCAGVPALNLAICRV